MMPRLVKTALLAAALVLPAGVSAQEPEEGPRLSRWEATLPADTTQTYDEKTVQRKPTLANGAEVMGVLERSYPPLLRDAGVGGRVWVRFVVDENGLPGDPLVSKLEAPPEIALAALRVVRSMRFHPGRDHGSRVRVSVDLPITFQVQGGPWPPRPTDRRYPPRP